MPDRVSCVWLYRYKNNQIEVLFQKRSNLVDGNPGKWDVSTGGHVNTGENFVDAAVREAAEEIGATLDPKKLQLIYIDKISIPPTLNIIKHYFGYDWSDCADDFLLDEQEVSEVKWVPLKDFDTFVDAGVKQPLRENLRVRELTKKFLEHHGNL